VSGQVTSVARVEDVQIFLKDPVYKVRFSGWKSSPNYTNVRNKCKRRSEIL